MRVLIGVDPTKAAETACDFVAGRTWPANTVVFLVAAIDPASDWLPARATAARPSASSEEDLDAMLDVLSAPLRRAGLIVHGSVEHGEATDVLKGFADEAFADLIVVGSRGLGPIASAVLGSVSAHLVDHAPCPVLVARSPSACRMIVATDGTDSSYRIPHVLGSWGPAFRGLPVEVISVSPSDAFVTPWMALGDEGESDLELHEEIARRVAGEMADRGWSANAIVRSGSPAREIVAACRETEADLIVTGSRGLGTLRRFALGSVAHDVLMHARASVLVMRGLTPAPARLAARAPSISAAT